MGRVGRPGQDARDCRMGEDVLQREVRPTRAIEGLNVMRLSDLAGSSDSRLPRAVGSPTRGSRLVTAR